MFGSVLRKSSYSMATVVTMKAFQDADEMHPSNKANNSNSTSPKTKKSNEILKRAQKLVRKKMLEIGMPGLVIGVSVNGKDVWSRGFGYADIENEVPCKPCTIMRIASISKCLTMAAVGKLIEDDKLSLNAKIQEYVPDFPCKYHENKKVDLTLKMLLSHTSGIRHYQKKEETETKDENTQTSNDKERDKSKTNNEKGEWDRKEFYSMKPYKSVSDALEMFKNDLLFHKPGEKYLYTTHGYTLVSAVVEKAASEDFVVHMKKLFHKLGMNDTFAEYPTDIVYHRARHYRRNDKGRLVNVPYVDNSYKWAGGGFISNVPDLLKFGNTMLYSFQYSGKHVSKSPGFLKSDTVKMMWSPVVKPEIKSEKIVRTNGYYGLGWEVYPHEKEFEYANEYDFEVLHTGGAIGASSVLYILPSEIKENETSSKQNDDQIKDSDLPFDNRNCIPPHGIVIAILTNLQGVNLTGLAREVAREFKTVANSD